jgi:hypothetical protein
MTISLNPLRSTIFSMTSTQACIRQKAHRLTGFDQRDRLAEFNQPIGLDQRRKKARALAWEPGPRRAEMP